MADSTPTHLPSRSTTGTPLIWFLSIRRAASRSGISSVSWMTLRVIRSSAVRANSGLLGIDMAHLLSDVSQMKAPRASAATPEGEVAHP
jgi:hypothetical protein